MSKSYQVNENSFKALIHKGRALTHLDRLAEAKKQLELALKIEPGKKDLINCS